LSNFREGERGKVKNREKLTGHAGETEKEDKKRKKEEKERERRRQRESVK